jgi:hypothetical protein
MAREDNFLSETMGVHIQYHRFCWKNILLLQIFEDAWTVKHTNCEVFQECVISKALDGAEDDILLEKSKISEHNSKVSGIVGMKILWDSITSKTSYCTDTLLRI